MERKCFKENLIINIHSISDWCPSSLTEFCSSKSWFYSSVPFFLKNFFWYHQLLTAEFNLICHVLYSIFNMETKNMYTDLNQSPPTIQKQFTRSAKQGQFGKHHSNFSRQSSNDLHHKGCRVVCILFHNIWW